MDSLATLTAVAGVSAAAAAWAALGLAILAVVGVLLGPVLRRRRAEARGAGDHATWARLYEAEERSRELEASLAIAHEEEAWLRRLLAVGETIDIDEALDRALTAAADVPGVVAAMLVVAAGDAIDSEPIVATFGLSPEEVEARRDIGVLELTATRAVVASYHYGDRNGEEEPVRGGIALPLTADGTRIGTLAVFWRQPDAAPGEADVRRLEELANHAAAAVLNAQRYTGARRLAGLDPLTGLHNRRHFEEAMEREIARAQRYDRPLALLLVDVDRFKRINDAWGHQTGDLVLVSLAEVLTSLTRAADIVCRVGGDEFAVLLPESSSGDADRLRERIGDALAVASAPVEFDVSVGVAELQRDQEPAAFFHRADQALYAAKARPPEDAPN